MPSSFLTPGIGLEKNCIRAQMFFTATNNYLNALYKPRTVFNKLTQLLLNSTGLPEETKG
jgi:hypothetical protein